MSRSETGACPFPSQQRKSEPVGDKDFFTFMLSSPGRAAKSLSSRDLMWLSDHARPMPPDRAIHVIDSQKKTVSLDTCRFVSHNTPTKITPRKPKRLDHNQTQRASRPQRRRGASRSW